MNVNKPNAGTQDSKHVFYYSDHRKTDSSSADRTYKQFGCRPLTISHPETHKTHMRVKGLSSFSLGEPVIMS